MKAPSLHNIVKSFIYIMACMFIFELGMKPCIHLYEISIFFSLNYVIVKTYQNYDQSRQKLGTFLENKGF